MPFHCSRCSLTFEAALPRCPKCLRQTSVHEVGAAATEHDLGRRLDRHDQGRSFNEADGAPAIPIGRALLRIAGAAAVSGLLLAGLMTAGRPLEGTLWWWPTALGVMLFAYVSVKLASGRHGSAHMPFVLVIGFSGTMALALTLGSAVVNWALGERALIVKILVGLALFVVLLALVTRPVAKLMDRLVRGK